VGDDVIKLTYEGPPAFAGFFAQLLREEGLTVNYDPTDEPRDATGALVLVGVVFQITGPVPWLAIWYAVRKFRASRLGRGQRLADPLS
jgi:hypothetical protein